MSGAVEIQLETNLHDTEVLIEILRPPMDLFDEMHNERYRSRSDDSSDEEVDRLAPHIIGWQATDDALMKHYTTVDPVLEAREEQIRRLDRRARDDIHESVKIYKALHVLTRIQETWLVKFAAEVPAHDTWGRAFVFGHTMADNGAEILLLASIPV